MIGYCPPCHGTGWLRRVDGDARECMRCGATGWDRSLAESTPRSAPRVERYAVERGEWAIRGVLIRARCTGAEYAAGAIARAFATRSGTRDQHLSLICATAKVEESTALRVIGTWVHALREHARTILSQPPYYGVEREAVEARARALEAEAERVERGGDGGTVD